MFAVLSRAYGKKQTTSCLVAFDQDRVVMNLCSLELPYLENHQNISCIPEGEYECEKIYSRKHGECFWIKDVSERSNILIHAGNYAAEKMILERAINLNLRKVDTLGCILVGMTFGDLNEDGNLDTVDSKKAMQILIDTMPQKFKIYIR